jgi:dTDP-4-amino-4,6-dideoxygalactose transaminase
MHVETSHLHSGRHAVLPPATIPLMHPAAIHLAHTTLSGSEMRYLAAAVEMRHVGSGGQFARRVEALLSQAIPGTTALLTPSCTAALEMCALLLRLQPGDEVIVPSFTFVSTASAFALFGARPVFADSLPGTLNIDPVSVEKLITPRTRAIVCMHYAGVACEMNELQRIATKNGITLIEDFAHGPFGSYRGQKLGTFGGLATLSFHATKNFACGEGGALLVNDPALLERAHVIRDKGTDRRLFLQGGVDMYTWRDLGSSYVMADMLAAFLLGQLENREVIVSRRERVHRAYDAMLADWAATHGVRLPVVPEYCTPSWHLYHLLLPRARDQSDFIAHLNRAGIGCAFHYVPLNTTPFGMQLGGSPGDCPVSESAAARLVRLPLHGDISDAEIGRVVNAAVGWQPA